MIGINLITKNKMTLGVIDIGIGNLGSLKSALNKLQISFRSCSEKEDFENINKIILPGVGNFKKFMSVLESKKIDKVINYKIEQNASLLGICLGFQILFDKSDEDGPTNGLKILKGEFKHLNEVSKDIKVPHTGWNECTFKKKNKLFNEIPDKSDFYFTHKFYLKNYDDKVVISKTDYHLDFVSSVSNKKIYGVQFHPEKSQLNGLKLLKNFAENC